MSTKAFSKAATPQDLGNELLDEAGKPVPNLWRIQHLLDRGACIEARDAEGRTPLLLATANNSTDAALFLIGCGANINACDGKGEFVLLNAANHRNLPVLKPLLERGALGGRGGGGITGEMWDRYINSLCDEIAAAEAAETRFPVLKPFKLLPPGRGSSN